MYTWDRIPAIQRKKEKVSTLKKLMKQLEKETDPSKRAQLIIRINNVKRFSR